MEVKFLMLPIVFSYASALIVPQELSSLLSVAYSNIPPIKKGTDSRVGFGFAFGNHADFQVLFELGPQTNTAKIGAPFSSSGNSKRHASAPSGNNSNRLKLEGSDANKYLQSWAERINSKEPFDHRPIPASSNVALVELPEQKPGEFLHLEDAVVELYKNDKGQIEIKQPPPDDVPVRALYQLKKLYNQNGGSEELALVKEQNPKRDDLKDNYERLSTFNVRRRTPEDVKKITESLSDVDLD